MSGFFDPIRDSVIRPIIDFSGRKILGRANVTRRLEAHEWAIRMASAQNLKERYPDLVPPTPSRDQLRPYEIRAFSEHGEDGILLYVFSRIGVTNRRFVEFGVEDGQECNAANLAVNFGFSGLLMDGSAENVARGRGFYDSILGPRSGDVLFLDRWITAENINEILTENGFTGEIDLLSVDIDGNDYWVWKAITTVQPRVVVTEYNGSLGPLRSITVPYDPSFNRWAWHDSGFYHGASLTALTKLAHEKGYALVGCESGGGNAFYVRNDLLEKLPLQTLSAEDAYIELGTRIRRGLSTGEQFDLIKHLPFTEV